jgi:hypothetical protein
MYARLHKHTFVAVREEQRTKPTNEEIFKPVL